MLLMVMPLWSVFGEYHVLWRMLKLPVIMVLSYERSNVRIQVLVRMARSGWGIGKIVSNS